MKRHINPHKILDPTNMFEVCENGSHPELDDARRIYKFGAYTFESATAAEKFFAYEGLDQKKFVAEPVIHREFSKNLIIINIVPKHMSRNERGLRSISA